MRNLLPAALAAGLLAAALAPAAEPAANPLPPALAKYFTPPPEFAGKLGDYRSPLRFADGSEVKDAAGWQRRRAEILKTWHDLMGPWPAVVEKPKVEVLKTEPQEGYARKYLRLQVAPDRTTEDAILLVPDGKGPFPAVLVVFYDAKTGVGLGKGPRRDFALQLVKRGFVTLSLGSPPETYYPTKATCRIQPLSFHAYVAANCYHALAGMPEVDPKRVGVTGHSYGGKWSMFASCLYDKFAAAAWSDGGIVFDEKRGNVNYWEPWYLGFDPNLKEQRKPGIPSEKNPRTGPYKVMMEQGRDLHELHALMAPRPFLVSGGSEDQPARWVPLNHAVAVNKLLGYENRVGMTNRPTHDPTADSNEVLCTFFEHFLKAK